MNTKLVELNTLEQCVELAAIAADIWNEYYSKLLSQQQIDYMLEKFQSVHAITDQIRNEGYEYYFMNADGMNVGYMGIKQEAGKLLLSKFYIRKEQRGNGYASRAMEFLTSLCKERRVAAIWLTVNRHNDTAIGVYEKKGFRTVRTQVADIGNGFVMDDFIMEKEI